MSVRHLRATGYGVMPWKNGRGSTAEIAREPAEGEFEWRVSMARVDEDGPFSLFPGYDRVILALDGDGMILHHREPATEITLGPLEPWSFSGDWSTTCTLRGGPFTDFNVITRRGRMSAELDVLRLDGSMLMNAPLSILFCVAGRFACGSIEVAKGETLITDAPVTIEAIGSAVVIRAALHRK